MYLENNKADKHPRTFQLDTKNVLIAHKRHVNQTLSFRVRGRRLARLRLTFLTLTCKTDLRNFCEIIQLCIIVECQVAYERRSLKLLPRRTRLTAKIETFAAPTHHPSTWRTCNASGKTFAK